MCVPTKAPRVLCIGIAVVTRMSEVNMMEQLLKSQEVHIIYDNISEVTCSHISF